MLQGWDFGVPRGGEGGSIFFQRSKGKISLNFRYHVNFNVLYQTLLQFSVIKDKKHIEQNFHSVAGIMPQGWDLGVLGGQKLKRGDFQWRPNDCAVLFQF